MYIAYLQNLISEMPKLDKNGKKWKVGLVKEYNKTKCLANYQYFTCYYSDTTDHFTLKDTVSYSKVFAATVILMIHTVSDTASLDQSLSWLVILAA